MLFPLNIDESVCGKSYACLYVFIMYVIVYVYIHVVSR